MTIRYPRRWVTPVRVSAVAPAVSFALMVGFESDLAGAAALLCAVAWLLAFLLDTSALDILERDVRHDQTMPRGPVVFDTCEKCGRAKPTTWLRNGVCRRGCIRRAA